MSTPTETALDMLERWLRETDRFFTPLDSRLSEEQAVIMELRTSVFAAMQRIRRAHFNAGLKVKR